jgi:hypothetical protein
MENLKEKDHSEDLGIGGRFSIGMDLWKIGWKVVNWMHMAQHKE